MPFPSATKDAVLAYRAAGFWNVPVPHREKKPVVEGWPDLRLKEDDLPRYFNSHPQNVGILLGDEYGTTDIDLDCPEAVRAARFFLPETGMIFGRASNPSSHWFYRSDPPQSSRFYKDTTGKMLVELRCQTSDGAVGLQTVVPPSTHQESGELIRFENGCGPMPANVDADVLLTAVARIAAAALLARHWPARGQGRHNTMLALAGGLARAGWPEEDTKLFCRAVYRSLSDPDPKARDRSDDEVEYTFKRMAEGKEFTGWPHVLQAVSDTVVDHVTAWLEIGSTVVQARNQAASQVQVVPRDADGNRIIDVTFTQNVASWPAPMSQEAFYGLAGEFIDLVQPHTEADPHFLLLMFLVYAGNVIGRKYYVMAGGDEHYTNLFVCGVGATSIGRKGSATGPVEKLFRDGSLAPGLGNLLPSLSSGEGLIWQIRDPIFKKVKNKRTKEIEEDLVDEGVEDKRLLVNVGEFISVIQMMRRQGNTLSPVVRSAWESGYLVSPTKNSPAKSTGAHVSIVAAISREELLRAVEETDADNGLLNRFLWCCSRRSKALPEGGKLWEVIESPAWRSLQEDFNKKTFGASQRIQRDADAADIWGRDYHPEQGVYAVLSRERYGLAGAATARAAAQVLRLSLLYAVLDGQQEIQKEHLDAGLAVWDYCEASARYVFGDALGDPIADAVLKALRAAPTGLTRTELRDHFHRRRTEGEITARYSSCTAKGWRGSSGRRPVADPLSAGSRPAAGPGDKRVVSAAFYRKLSLLFSIYIVYVVSIDERDERGEQMIGKKGSDHTTKGTKGPSGLAVTRASEERRTVKHTTSTRQSGVPRDALAIWAPGRSRGSALSSA